ncbi:MAG: carbohydrate ABC transporter permease [Cellulosilyticaceae bacterium]
MKKTKAQMRQIIAGYGFISIWIIGFLAFSLYPLVYSFYLSLNNVTITANGIQTSFLGAENYYKLFTLDLQFVQDLLGYFQHIMMNVPLVIILSLIIALLLNSKIKGKSIFRGIYFLPVIIISGPLLEIFYKNQVFEQMIDFENIKILQIIAQSNIGFVTQIIEFLTTGIVETLWYTGVPIVIFIVGLQKLPKDMYEASYIDGASAWQSFWKLTLPSLGGYIMINTIYTVIQISFMDNQPLIKILSSRMFDLKYGFGYAAAIAWVLFAVLILVIAVFMGILFIFSRKKGGK